MFDEDSLFYPSYGSFVILKKNGQEGRSFDIEDQDMIFGRSEDADVRIQLHSVSRQHARIYVDDKNQVWVANLSKTGFTVVNGSVIEEPLPLKNNDVLCICDRRFRFQSADVESTLSENLLNVSKLEEKAKNTTPKSKSGVPRTPLQECTNTKSPASSSSSRGLSGSVSLSSFSSDDTLPLAHNIVRKGLPTPIRAAIEARRDVPIKDHPGISSIPASVSRSAQKKREKSTVHTPLRKALEERRRAMYPESEEEEDANDKNEPQETSSKKNKTLPTPIRKEIQARRKQTPKVEKDPNPISAIENIDAKVEMSESSFDDVVESMSADETSIPMIDGVSVILPTAQEDDTADFSAVARRLEMDMSALDESTSEHLVQTSNDPLGDSSMRSNGEKSDAMVSQEDSSQTQNIVHAKTPRSSAKKIVKKIIRRRVSRPRKQHSESIVSAEMGMSTISDIESADEELEHDIHPSDSDDHQENSLLGEKVLAAHPVSTITPLKRSSEKNPPLEFQLRSRSSSKNVEDSEAKVSRKTSRRKSVSWSSQLERSSPLTGSNLSIIEASAPITPIIESRRLSVFEDLEVNQSSAGDEVQPSERLKLQTPVRDEIASAAAAFQIRQHQQSTPTNFSVEEGEELRVPRPRLQTPLREELLKATLSRGFTDEVLDGNNVTEDEGATEERSISPREEERESIPSRPRLATPVRLEIVAAVGQKAEIAERRRLTTPMKESIVSAVEKFWSSKIAEESSDLATQNVEELEMDQSVDMLSMETESEKQEELDMPSSDAFQDSNLVNELAIQKRLEREQRRKMRQSLSRDAAEMLKREEKSFERKSTRKSFDMASAIPLLEQAEKQAGRSMKRSSQRLSLTADAARLIAENDKRADRALRRSQRKSMSGAVNDLLDREELRFARNEKKSMAAPRYSIGNLDIFEEVDADDEQEVLMTTDFPTAVTQPENQTDSSMIDNCEDETLGVFDEAVVEDENEVVVATNPLEISNEDVAPLNSSISLDVEVKPFPSTPIGPLSTEEESVASADDSDMQSSQKTAVPNAIHETLETPGIKDLFEVAEKKASRVEKKKQNRRRSSVSYGFNVLFDGDEDGKANDLNESVEFDAPRELVLEDGEAATKEIVDMSFNLHEDVDHAEDGFDAETDTDEVNEDEDVDDDDDDDDKIISIPSDHFSGKRSFVDSVVDEPATFLFSPRKSPAMKRRKVMCGRRVSSSFDSLKIPAVGLSHEEEILAQRKERIRSRPVTLRSATSQSVACKQSINEALTLAGSCFAAQFTTPVSEEVIPEEESSGVEKTDLNSVAGVSETVDDGEEAPASISFADTTHEEQLVESSQADTESPTSKKRLASEVVTTVDEESSVPEEIEPPKKTRSTRTRQKKSTEVDVGAEEEKPKRRYTRQKKSDTVDVAPDVELETPVLDDSKVTSAPSPRPTRESKRSKTVSVETVDDAELKISSVTEEQAAPAPRRRGGRKATTPLVEAATEEVHVPEKRTSRRKKSEALVLEQEELSMSVEAEIQEVQPIAIRRSRRAAAQAATEALEAELAPRATRRSTRQRS